MSLGAGPMSPGRTSGDRSWPGGRGDVNTSSCAWCTARSNKLKHRRQGQRKVYFRAMQGEWVAHAPGSPELPEGFNKTLLKA